MLRGRKIVVTLRKGGVGKTTAAINLAIYLAQVGRKVVYLDLDSQQDGFDFFRERAVLYPDKPLVTHLALDDPDQVEIAMRTASEHGADVVVDCPPLDPPQVLRAQQVGDILFFPFKSGGNDLRAFSRALSLYQGRVDKAVAEGRPADKPQLFAIINEFVKAQINDKMLYGWITQAKVFQLLGTWGRRVDFKDAISKKLAVFEYAPDSPSAEEVLSTCEAFHRSAE